MNGREGPHCAESDQRQRVFLSLWEGERAVREVAHWLQLETLGGEARDMTGFSCIFLVVCEPVGLAVRR